MTVEPKKASQNPEEISRQAKEFESEVLRKYSSYMGDVIKGYLHSEEELKKASMKGRLGQAATSLMISVPSVMGLATFHEFGHMLGLLSATDWKVGGNISIGFGQGRFSLDRQGLNEYIQQATRSQMGNDYKLLMEYRGRNMLSMSAEELQEYSRLQERYTNLLSENSDKIELNCVMAGPLFDIISSLSLVLVTALLRKKHKFLSKVTLTAAVSDCMVQIFYAYRCAYGGFEMGDYFRIAEKLNLPPSTITGIFITVFAGIIGLAFLAAFYPDKLDKQINDYIKNSKIKTGAGKEVKTATVWEKWNKDYDSQITDYILSHFFKSDLSKLQKYEQKKYSADSIKYFDKIHDEAEVYSQLCASVFGLSAICKDYAVEFAPAKMFYMEFAEIPPLKDAVSKLRNIAKKLASIFEEMQFLKQDNGVISVINQMRVDVCNQHMKVKYNVELPKDSKINNLMLEILAAREMEKAYSTAYGEKNENTIKIKQRLMELLKEDTEIHIFFSALLDVYFNEEYFRDYRLYGFVKESRIRNANHLIGEANKILENLPEKIREFFAKKPEVLVKLKKHASEFNIPDTDFENIKPILKINKMTKFDYLTILDAVTSNDFNDENEVPKYSKILADALVKKTNEDYFEDPEKLSRKYEIDYNNLKKMWEKTIKANREYVLKLEKLTSSSIVEAGKKIVEEAKKKNVAPERIELVKKVISASV